MPSTYSPSLRIELVGEGEQDGIWGQTTNNNLGELIEQAIAGITTVDVTAANVTLTSFNGTVDEARSAVLVVTGSNVVAREVTIPNEPKTYIVTNNTSQTVGIKTSSGTAFSCVAGTQTTLYCDGSNGVFGASIVLTPPTYETLVNPLITGIRETATVSATAATGTINFDVATASVWYYTSNATANHTLNFRYSSGVSLNTALATGDAITLVWLNTNGSTAYYPNVIQIDGSTVTPKVPAAITAGNASAIDAYSFTIIKTASATFTVLETQTKFA